MIAIFDFDGTLCYAPSGVLVLRLVNPIWRILYPPTYLLGFIGLRGMHRLIEERGIVGIEIEKIKEIGRKLPPVKAGVNLAKDMSKKGDVIVLSYTLEPIIDEFLRRHGIHAKVYAKRVEAENGKITGFSKDFVTETLLSDQIDGKRKIIEKLGIEPDLCVGDSKRRDKLCDNYIDIRDLEPNYRGKIRQILELKNYHF